MILFFFKSANLYHTKRSPELLVKRVFFCYIFDYGVTLEDAIPYSVLASLSVLIFALVHLLAPFLANLDTTFHSRFLSMGGGIAIAYVFIDLLPKLCKGDLVVKEVLQGVFPYFEKHVYVLALLGFLLFFLVSRLQKSSWEQVSFSLSLSSYALFNFLVGYAVTYKEDPDIQPLVLFTFAIALHYFTNDYTMSREHPQSYNAFGRWVLIGSLFLGWSVGSEFLIAPAAIALVNAFIGGGVILNVTRHELPTKTSNNTFWFLFGAFFYTVLLLV